MIFTAANQYENFCGDYSTENLDFDTFSYYFTCALNGSTYEGKPVNADTNDDGRVSMFEAFLYAQFMDKETENPQMDDSGDGIPTCPPSPTATPDRQAANTWIKINPPRSRTSTPPATTIKKRCFSRCAGAPFDRP
jgi:hypothetical protein